MLYMFPCGVKCFMFTSMCASCFIEKVDAYINHTHTMDVYSFRTRVDLEEIVYFQCIIKSKALFSSTYTIYSTLNCVVLLRDRKKRNTTNSILKTEDKALFLMKNNFLTLINLYECRSKVTWNPESKPWENTGAFYC